MDGSISATSQEEVLPLTVDQLPITEERKPLTVDHLPLRHAPKIYSDTCLIDWNQSALSIYNKIRGLSPYPGAAAFINKKKLKIYSWTMELVQHNIYAGLADTDYKTYLKFACKDGYIYLTDLQLEGKKRMPIEEFLRGFRL